MIENASAIFDLSVRYQPTNPNNLLPIVKVWFQLVLSNLCPRGINLNTLTHDDRLLVHLLVNHERVNLPQTIFNHLRYSIVVSREEYHSFIPFGRVLSALLFKAEIIKDIRINGPEYALVEKRCEVFRV